MFKYNYVTHITEITVFSNGYIDCVSPIKHSQSVHVLGDGMGHGDHLTETVTDILSPCFVFLTIQKNTLKLN